MKKLPITLRGMTPSDIPYIKNSWLTSYRNSTYAWKIPNPVYFKVHGLITTNMLEKSEVVLAVNEDDPDQIFGYIVFEPFKISHTPIIHYICVKSSFRHFGVATELLEEALHESSHKEDLPILVTHFSKEFERFCSKVFIYNPYLLGEYL